MGILQKLWRGPASEKRSPSMENLSDVAGAQVTT
jgi:hypothetical protein